MKTMNTTPKEALIQYLREHPDFFKKHPELLSELELPVAPPGTVSLVERQIRKLREQNQNLQTQLLEVLRNAQRNEHLLGQTTSLIRSLIGCHDLRQLADTLIDAMPKLFQIDVVRLYTEQLPGHEGVAEVCAELGLFFPHRHPICGACDAQTAELLFGRTDIRSVALVPIGRHADMGLLALGHHEPDNFDPNTGTLFLDTIGLVLEALCQKLAFANG